jgi:2-polyprenyl-3-methyl-5-hydroxy-6-metoxy-1,4-benzoquinol methylase
MDNNNIKISIVVIDKIIKNLILHICSVVMSTKQYDVFLKYIKPGMRVLDAGCGEGVLSVMLAQRR